MQIAPEELTQEIMHVATLIEPIKEQSKRLCLKQLLDFLDKLSFDTLNRTFQIKGDVTSHQVIESSIVY